MPSTSYPICRLPCDVKDTKNRVDNITSKDTLVNRKPEEKAEKAQQQQQEDSTKGGIPMCVAGE